MEQSSHYDSSYFDWQKSVGAFGGMANKFKFVEHVGPGDKVLDFGCGGGFILAALNVKERMGVELNPTAREEATRNGVKAVASTEEVPDGWADVIISNNALEHTFSPLDEIKKLKSKVKVGGKIVFVVPQEFDMPWNKEDIHRHLYSWSPACIGNLFDEAGYEVQSIDIIKNLWPPKYQMWRKLLGEKGFFLMSYLYGSLFGEWRQLKIVAKRNS